MGATKQANNRALMPASVCGYLLLLALPLVSFRACDKTFVKHVSSYILICGIMAGEGLCHTQGMGAAIMQQLYLILDQSAARLRQ
jgi:hypothetical protein